MENIVSITDLTILANLKFCGNFFPKNHIFSLKLLKMISSLLIFSCTMNFDFVPPCTGLITAFKNKPAAYFCFRQNALCFSGTGPYSRN